MKDNLPTERFLVLPEVFSGFGEDQLIDGVWIHAAPLASFEHPLYGTVTVDEPRVDRFIRNYDNKVYGQDVPINYEHFGMDAAKGYKAAGWINSVERREDGMWLNVKFSREAVNEIKDGAWRYFSPEWHAEWEDPATLITYKDVLVGGALTNQPFFKNMVPLNFSAVLATLPAKNEVADWEHSEPASGPEPREDNDDSDAQGTRGTSPVVEPPDDAYDLEVEASMEEFLKKLGELLAIEGEPTEEAVTVALSNVVAEVTPIREAVTAATETQLFSERYPTEFAKLKNLEDSDRQSKAHAFADRYAKARAVEGEGDEAKETSYGFSALAVQKIEDMHLAFSNGQIEEKHITETLDTFLNSGLVNYGEEGSSRTEDEGATAETTAQAFANKVASIVTEDKVDYSTAVRMAAERHPQLARGYAESARTT